jgi:hypothetical protein
MCKFKHYLSYSLLVFSSALSAHTYQGELEVLVIDDFTHKKSQTVYQLNESGHTYKLNIPDSVNKENLVTGKKIVIEGGEEVQKTQNSTSGNPEKVINVRTIDVLSIGEPQAETATTTGTNVRKVLILLVNFTNIKATTTVSWASVNIMVFTGTKSSNKNIRLSSFNQEGFSSDGNGDSKPDIYVVNLPYATSDCNYNQWAYDAKNAAASRGINLALYRHFMFVLPKTVNCTWGGLGTVGCGTSCSTWIRAYEPTMAYANLVYTHELGHNLGMRHAATDTNNDGIVESEYGDYSCIMGNSPYPQVNAIHRDQLGWFAQYPTLRASVSAGQYTISPLDLGIRNMRLKVLKVQRNSTETYYITLRKTYDPFSLTSTFDNKVHIHKAKAGDARSYFIRTLLPGETFIDSGSSVRIKAVSTAPDGSSAIIKVN